MNGSQQCALAVAKGDCALGSTSMSKLRNVIVHISLVAVRLHLEYCIQCGALQYR